MKWGLLFGKPGSTIRRFDKCSTTALFVGFSLLACQRANATPIQIYGVWHAENDACIWGSVRDLTEFDQKNHWIIDRGDGKPSVNLVILSFVQPLNLLKQTTDAGTLNGVPRGMTQEIVNYFTSHGIRAMFRPTLCLLS